MGSRAAAAAAAAALRKTADLALRTSLHDHETSGHGLGTRKTFKHHDDFSIGTSKKRRKKEEEKRRKKHYKTRLTAVCISVDLWSDVSAVKRFKVKKKKKKKGNRERRHVW